jgi:hypothetical protein
MKLLGATSASEHGAYSQQPTARGHTDSFGPATWRRQAGRREAAMSWSPER